MWLESGSGETSGKQGKGSVSDVHPALTFAKDTLGEVVICLRHFFGLHHPLAKALAIKLKNIDNVKDAGNMNVAGGMGAEADGDIHQSAVFWGMGMQEERLKKLEEMEFGEMQVGVDGNKIEKVKESVDKDTRLEDSNGHKDKSGKDKSGKDKSGKAVDDQLLRGR